MDHFSHHLEEAARSIVVPQTLTDPLQALTVAYWVSTVMGGTFRNDDDKASFVEVKDSPNHSYIELFVAHHCLREYTGEALDKAEFRFHVHREMDKEPIWWGNTLKSAMVALLTLDAQFATSQSWDTFFKQHVSSPPA